MAERKRNEDLTWDDQITPDNEAPAAPPPEPTVRQRGRQWLRDMGGADEVDARWTPGWGERGWLTLRDPFTGERHEVPTKYAPSQPWRTVEGVEAEPAPQWLVRRAMEKLPPRPPKGSR